MTAALQVQKRRRVTFDIRAGEHAALARAAAAAGVTPNELARRATLAAAAGFVLSHAEPALPMTPDEQLRRALAHALVDVSEACKLVAARPAGSR
jgi:hypothetical protein